MKSVNYIVAGIDELVPQNIIDNLRSTEKVSRSYGKRNMNDSMPTIEDRTDSTTSAAAITDDSKNILMKKRKKKKKVGDLE